MEPKLDSITLSNGDYTPSSLVVNASRYTLPEIVELFKSKIELFFIGNDEAEELRSFCINTVAIQDVGECYVSYKDGEWAYTTENWEEATRAYEIDVEELLFYRPKYSYTYSEESEEKNGEFSEAFNTVEELMKDLESPFKAPNSKSK